jgi:hypothetical protein
VEVDCKPGADVADRLMEHLPPAGWSDLARRSDVDGLGQSLRLEMQAMESRLDAKFADLRTDMAALRGWTSDKVASQTRWLMASQLVLVGALIGSVTAIAH